MAQFLIKRLVGLVFILIGVTFITFMIGYLAPGDPIRDMLGPHANPVAYEQLRHSYGLDLPWYQQYWNFITNMLRGNLGRSFQTINRPVTEILRDGVPVSLELGFWGLLTQLLIGVPLGLAAALRAGKWSDTLSMVLALTFYALPSYILAVLFQVIIVFLHSTTGFSWPVSGWGNTWQYSFSDIQYKIGPILIYAAIGMAYYARLARTSTLEVLKQDYIRTARSKGLKEPIVVRRHVIRNALIPLVTAFGVALGFLVGGAFFIETIFNIP